MTYFYGITKEPQNNRFQNSVNYLSSSMVSRDKVMDVGTQKIF